MYVKGFKSIWWLSRDIYSKSNWVLHSINAKKRCPHSFSLLCFSVYVYYHISYFYICFSPSDKMMIGVLKPISCKYCLLFHREVGSKICNLKYLKKYYLKLKACTHADLIFFFCEKPWFFPTK